MGISLSEVPILKLKNGDDYIKDINIEETDNNLDEKTVLDVLNFLQREDKINISGVQEEIKMYFEQQILQKHVYKIWQGKDSKWRTYVEDITKNDGRRLIKRNTKKDLERFLIDFYQKNSSITFKIRYELWKERQINVGVSDNTIFKYDSEFKRFIEGTELENIPVDCITDELIGKTLKSRILEKKTPWRALKQIFGVIKNVLEHSLREGVIKENVCDYMDITLLRKYCVESNKKITSRTLTDEEMVLLYQRLEKDHINYPTVMTTYAVQFIMFTGMRVGEVAALSWENVDFDNKYIYVYNYESLNRRTKEYSIIARTKNGDRRVIPMTEEVKKLLLRVKEEEIKYGFDSEYVFSGEKGRIHFMQISDCVRTKVKQIGVEDNKGAHALRRTFNSKLRCNGVSGTVASSIIGNSERVNDEHYTYDVSHMDYKNDMMTKVNNDLLIMYEDAKGNQTLIK